MKPLLKRSKHRYFRCIIYFTEEKKGVQIRKYLSPIPL